MEPAWYCICTQFKHEHIAAAHLRQIHNLEVFHPQFRLVRSTRRGPVQSTESLFPNYLFTRFVLSASLEKVRHIPGVKRVLQFGDSVPRIPDLAIEELRRDLEATFSEVFTDSPGEGEEVEVAAGALRGLKGPVTRVLPAKQRVQVLLDLMGRSISAELSLEMLMFRKKGSAIVALQRESWRAVCGRNTGAILEALVPNARTIQRPSPVGM